MKVNEKSKASVFSALFSKPDVLRELYCAIEGITLPPDTPIDINTLEDVLYMDQINDVSFTIDNRLVVLIEHQSTINLNMPLRLLIYIARIYEKIIDRRKFYKKNLEPIPAPEFIVLYNGKEAYPDHSVLRLSDSFKAINGLKSVGVQALPLELIANVYNINHGHNQAFMERSETLDGYSVFVEKTREYGKSQNREEAMKNAIKYCVENDILRQFLETNGSEVLNMLLDWNTEDAIAASYEDGLEEGIEKGREEEKINIVRNLKALGLSTEILSKSTGLNPKDIEIL
jgi:predicted transposase YdaD